MKKLISILLILFAASFLLSSSCNKNDNPPAPIKTKTQLLTQSPWKFKSATAGGSDASGFLQACQKDNIYTFAAAGTGTTDEGPSKCNTGDPQITSFTWNFASNETMLQVSSVFFSNTNTNFDLVSLTETELVVKTFYTPPIGPFIEVTITFQH